MSHDSWRLTDSQVISKWNPIYQFVSHKSGSKHLNKNKEKNTEIEWNKFWSKCIPEFFGIAFFNTEREKLKNFIHFFMNLISNGNYILRSEYKWTKLLKSTFDFSVNPLNWVNGTPLMTHNYPKTSSAKIFGIFVYNSRLKENHKKLLK